MQYPGKVFLLTTGLMLSLLLSLKAQLIVNAPGTCQNITGQVCYFNNAGTPVHGAWVFLNASTGGLLQITATDQWGFFSFCQEAPGDYVITATAYQPAGGINAIDALLVARHYTEFITLEGIKYLAGDVNGSAYLNANDALLILQRYVELILTFPVGDWVFEEASCTVEEGSVSIVNIKGLCYGDVDGSFQPVDCTPMPTPADAGPDQAIIGTSTSLEGNVPVNGIGNWSILAGEGGSFGDPADPFTAFNGLAGNTYTLAWTITTECGSTSDTVLIGFSSTSFTCGLPFTDTRDGQVYGTVQIGTQCWMQQNLNIGIMINGTSMMVNDGIVEKFCYGNDPANCTVYGGLYQWDEMMGYTLSEGTRGICPEDWHIPTDAEWCTLTTFLDTSVDCNNWSWSGVDGGGKLKESGLEHWAANNAGATNESGFTALPGGYRSSGGTFYFNSSFAYLWTSTLNVTSSAISRFLGFSHAQVRRYYYNVILGLSVRCVRD